MATTETVNSRIVSYIRTYVPMGVGAAVSFLLLKSPALAGVLTAVAPGWQDSLAVIVTLLVQLAYYTGVRLAARRWPWVEKLLGSPLTPVYVTAEIQAAVTEAAELAQLSSDQAKSV